MSRLLMMGCDAHLDTITAAVIDTTGAARHTVTIPNTEPGWEQALELCRRLGISRVGIEGASGYGRRLAQTLSTEGITIVEVPARLTARTRRVDGAGKTDPGDARTIGRAVTRGDGHPWRDHPTLETLRVLTVRRDHLVAAQTADINQLRALLTEIDPHQAAHLGRLRSTRSFTTLTAFTTHGDPHRLIVAELIRTIATDCLARHHHINHLEHRISQLMPPAGKALIAQYQGCGTIVAAQLLAQLAGTAGFTTDAKMAAWAGTAPLDVSSGRHQRHRLNRGGNRQANRALHTIIITQRRCGGETATYIERRINQGKTTKEAIRAAKRHLTRRIWKTLHNYQLT